jgi:hypothetical protein
MSQQSSGGGRKRGMYDEKSIASYPSQIYGENKGWRYSFPGEISPLSCRRESVSSLFRNLHHQQTEEQFLSGAGVLDRRLHRLPVPADLEYHLRATDGALPGRERVEQADRSDAGIRVRLYRLSQHSSRLENPERSLGSAEVQAEEQGGTALEGVAHPRQDLHFAGLLQDGTGTFRRCHAEPPQVLARVRVNLPQRVSPEDEDVRVQFQATVWSLRLSQHPDEAPEPLGDSFCQQPRRVFVVSLHVVHCR